MKYFIRILAFIKAIWVSIWRKKQKVDVAGPITKEINIKERVKPQGKKIPKHNNRRRTAGRNLQVIRVNGKFINRIIYHNG